MTWQTWWAKNGKCRWVDKKIAQDAYLAGKQEGIEEERKRRAKDDAIQEGLQQIEGLYEDIVAKRKDED